MHEILTPQQMYRVDELVVSGGVRSLKLMEAAGTAIAQVIQKRFKKCPIAVICGPGNNGGDGFVVARLMKAKGWPVRVYLEGGSAKGDCSVMAKRWKGAIGTFSEFETSIGERSGPRLIVDAVYGAGLNRDFPGRLADGMHGAGVPIVSIDVPSGLDGLTGQPRHCSVKADVTVTFFRKKPAHVLYPGRAICGDVVVADIGIPDAVLADLDVTLYENARPDLPDRRPDMHKYSVGAALIYSGPELHTGASRLAAMAAARVGAGAVSICGAKAALREHAAHFSSIMLKTVGEIDPARYRACCIGPAFGVGDGAIETLMQVLGKAWSVVLDADALTSFTDAPSRLFEAITSAQAKTVVLTPHEGEFRRLFKDIASSDHPKHEKARLASRRSGAIVLYKGPDTVIAHPDGRAVINTNGSPKLATAGSGDVLAGIITGLLAQDVEEFTAVCAGAWLHANTAALTTRRSMIAEDMIEAL